MISLPSFNKFDTYQHLTNLTNAAQKSHLIKNKSVGLFYLISHTFLYYFSNYLFCHYYVGLYE